MNRILRILFVSKNQNKIGVFRFKIVYFRDLYRGYDADAGDELDLAIKAYFDATNPTQCFWEYVGTHDDSVTTRYLNSFCQRNIPLVLSASISGLTSIEMQNLLDSGKVFPDVNRIISLFYRCTLKPEDVNWRLLPTFIKLAMNHDTYQVHGNTIHPF